MASSKPRHPGIHEVTDERVLLVTKHRLTGAERCDWWPSVKEAENSDQIVLEVRDKVKVEKHKNDWKGLSSMLALALGKSGPQDQYLRKRPLDAREFFEPVDEKAMNRKELDGKRKKK